MSVNIPLYIQYGQIGQFSLANKYANDLIFKGVSFAPDYIPLLFTIEETVEDQYALTGSTPSLEWLANYMVALSGIWPINTTPPVTTFIIILQPQSLTVDTGDNASFLVAVAGGTSPYSYQWYFNNVALSGETDPTLDLTNVDSGDAGNYKCIIMDANGQTLTSVNATLTVTAPIITVYASYGDVDPNTDLQAHVDNFTYQINFNIIHNANISVTIPQAQSLNKYWIIKVPNTESDKTAWNNGPFNFGVFPDSVWRALITFGGFDYYYTRIAASFDYTIPLILS